MKTVFSTLITKKVLLKQKSIIPKYSNDTFLLLIFLLKFKIIIFLLLLQRVILIQIRKLKNMIIKYLMKKF